MPVYEDEMLIAVFDWVRVMCPMHPEMLNILHVENEHNRPVRTDASGRRFCASGKRAKRKGLSKGYPDIVVEVPRGTYHGLRIELKTSSGRVSAEQSDWLKRLNEHGYKAVVCRSIDDTIDTIKDYLGLNN